MIDRVILAALSLGRPVEVSDRFGEFDYVGHVAGFCTEYDEFCVIVQFYHTPAGGSDVVKAYSKIEIERIEVL